tara:strand:- start:9362 stop:9850 length:489 start_codon:yes stop_codon:yes gene_type:complete
MKKNIIIVFLLPMVLLADPQVQEQATMIASCRGKTLNIYCYDTPDCGDAILLKQLAITPFKEGGMQVLPLNRVLDSFERRYKARYQGASPKSFEIPRATPPTVVYYNKADLACANAIAKAASMVSEEYQIPSTGRVSLPVVQASKNLTPMAGHIELWWSNAK